MEDQGDVMDQAVGKLSSSKAQGPKNRCANGKVGKIKTRAVLNYLQTRTILR